MRAVVQRVNHAAVEVEGRLSGEIGQGVLILLGIEAADEQSDIDWLVPKITRLRIFGDEQGVMNRSLLDVGGAALVVSQFTLHASVRKGNRPYYGRAAAPEEAVPLYERFVQALRQQTGRPVPTGEFGARMKVRLENDGPVTILLDSRNIE